MVLFGNSLVLPQKVNVELPYNLGIPFLGVYPREMETCSHKTCTRRLIAALFIIDKRWKQPRCSLTDEWINKTWNIHTIKYHSSIKRNEVMVYIKTWNNLKNTILSKRSLAHKVIY